MAYNCKAKTKELFLLLQNIWRGLLNKFNLQKILKSLSVTNMQNKKNQEGANTLKSMV